MAMLKNQRVYKLFAPLVSRSADCFKMIQDLAGRSYDGQTPGPSKVSTFGGLHSRAPWVDCPFVLNSSGKQW